MDNVFLDTCVFLESNFLENKRIKSIFTLAKNGDVQILLPKVIEDEIRNNLRKRVNEAKNRQDTYLNHSRILSNTKTYSDINEIDVELATEELNDKLDNLLNTDNVICLPYPNRGIDLVFDKYFNEKLPFNSTNKNNKKAEFPDAIALQAIENWCEDNKTKCSSFSNDPDIKNYKSDLVKQRVLSEYLDKKSLVMNDRDNLKRIKQAFREQKERLCKDIIDFSMYRMKDELEYYDDVNNMKIHSIEVKSSKVELDDNYKLQLFENNNSGFLESKATLNYEVIIEAGEKGNYKYDDETGEDNYMGTEKHNVKKRFEFVAGINFNFKERGDVVMSFDGIVSQLLVTPL